MSSVISDRHFHDEQAAYEYVEARIWPNGPVCPHCGNADQARFRLMQGKSTRIGVRQCNECRKPFTVKVGTVFEASPHSFADLVAGDPFALLVQEGDQLESASPHPRPDSQVRLIHEPSHS